MNAIVKWQALISLDVIVTYLWRKRSPIYQNSTQRAFPKESHECILSKMLILVENTHYTT